MPSEDDDPLSFAMRPPPGESDYARHMRLQREAAAKATSNRIDELLRAESVALKKKRGAGADVKLLLLGRSFIICRQVNSRSFKDKPKAGNQPFRNSFSCSIILAV